MFSPRFDKSARCTGGVQHSGHRWVGTGSVSRGRSAGICITENETTCWLTRHCCGAQSATWKTDQTVHPPTLTPAAAYAFWYSARSGSQSPNRRARHNNKDCVQVAWCFREWFVECCAEIGLTHPCVILPRVIQCARRRGRLGCLCILEQ